MYGRLGSKATMGICIQEQTEIDAAIMETFPIGAAGAFYLSAEINSVLSEAA
jgi:hypothetical protein